MELQSNSFPIIERRRRARIREVFPVDILVGRTSLSAKATNFNDHGLALISSHQLPASSPLSVVLRVPKSVSVDDVSAKARIVWRRSDHRGFLYGLNLIEIMNGGSPYLSREVEQRQKLIVASYLPDNIVKNEDLIRAGFNTTPTAIQRSLGAVERRAAGPNESAADMMARVAEKIFEKAALDPRDLDRIICLSNPGDSAEPDTSIAVQAKVGATCPAFGISMSCTGWIAAVDVALRYLTSGDKRILILAASQMGSRPHFHNMMHRAIFGDGAGGMLLEPHHRDDILAIAEIADGKYYSRIFLPYPWSLHPSGIPEEYKKSFYMASQQHVFFEAMDRYLPHFSDRLFTEAGISKEDVDLFLLHYPSKPLFEHSLGILKVPRSKVVGNYERCGNLVAAEIPILLDEAIESGRTKSGDLIFTLTYGAGFTMGGMILRLR